MPHVTFSAGRSSETLLLADGRLLYIDTVLDDNPHWRLALSEDQPESADIDLSVLEAVLAAGEEHRDWAIRRTVEAVGSAQVSEWFAGLMLDHGEEIRERPLTGDDWQEFLDQAATSRGAQRELSLELAKALVCLGLVPLEQWQSWLKQQAVRVRPTEVAAADEPPALPSG